MKVPFRLIYNYNTNLGTVWVYHVIFLLQVYNIEPTIQIICTGNLLIEKKKWIVLRTDGFRSVKATKLKQ